jgi:hypothetical protein
MSNIAAKFRRSQCAIWRAAASGDGYGDTISLVGSYPCQFITDGKMQRDSSGVEFMPSGVFSLGVYCQAGDYIALVTSTAPDQPPADAQQIRKVVISTLHRGQPDYLAYTS